MICQTDKRIFHNGLHFWGVLAPLALWFFLSASLAGQTPPGPPAETRHPADTTAGLLTGQRVMQTFDFEERQFHYLDKPMYWHKVTDRVGFAHYATGMLNSQRSRSGQYSFKLACDGSSIGFQYDRRRIHAKPGSDFQVTTFVYLENAVTARAQIGCALTDRTGKVIPGSRGTSRLVGSTETEAEGWRRLDVFVPGNFPEAKFITIDLWLLQEEQWNQGDHLETHIFQRDVHAAAWFDDITVYQLPRVVLNTSVPGNVFTGEQVVSLNVQVEGVSSLDYQVRLTVRSADDELIRDEHWTLAGIEGAAKEHNIELPELTPGLYRAELAIMSADLMIAARKLAFCKLAPLSAPLSTSGRDFGTVSLDIDSGDWDTAITMTRLLNARFLKRPVWRRQPDQPGAIISTADFDTKLIELQQSNIALVATFAEVPDDLAMQLSAGRRALLDVLSQDVDVWRSQVATVLVQYARQVPYWQIGADSHVPEHRWDPRIRSVVDTLRKEFTKVVSGTLLTVPVSSLFRVNRSQLGTANVALMVSNVINPEQIPDYLEGFRRRELKNIWVTIEPLDAEQYGREYLLIDFAKRVAFAKKALAQAVFVNHPWHQSGHKAQMLTEPTELFVVFRTLADQLGGARYMGQFDIAPGIPALIFDRNGQGCLFTWNNDHDPHSGAAPPEVKVALGGEPAMTDLFGNRTIPKTTKGLTHLQITHWPVLLTDINIPLAMLRAGLELSPPVVEASITRQRLNLRFVNPFNVPISGRLRFMVGQSFGKNWTIEPQSFSFALQPQQLFEQAIAMKFPRNELGGPKQLGAFFNIDADRTYSIAASVPFEIRLAGIDVSIFTRRVQDTDMLIQMVVTNDGEDEVSLNSFICLPDGDYRELAISRLQPGASVPKNFLVRNAAQWLGKYARIGLYDPKGTQRVNYHVEIN